jgi:hypothetical protein
VSFFSLAECSLSVRRYVSLDRKREREPCVTHAALFCAFRLDCAGVKSSLSTLFDRLSCPASASSKSRAMPPSKESLGSSERCCAIGDDELELFASPGALPFVPVDVSKLYSKADGTYPLASNDVSMLYITPRISDCACVDLGFVFTRKLSLPRQQHLRRWLHGQGRSHRCQSPSSQTYEVQVRSSCCSP